MNEKAHKTRMWTSGLREVHKSQFRRLDEPDLDVKVTKYLSDADMNSRENQRAISEHAQSLLLKKAISRLKKFNILSQENLDALLRHNDLVEVCEVLIELHHAGMLTPENRKAVCQAKQPERVFIVLKLLAKKHALTPENCEVIGKYDDIEDLMNALSEIKSNDWLTSERLETICQAEDLHDLFLALIYTWKHKRKSGSMTERDFELLLDPMWRCHIVPRIKTLELINFINDELRQLMTYSIVEQRAGAPFSKAIDFLKNLQDGLQTTNDKDLVRFIDKWQYTELCLAINSENQGTFPKDFFGTQLKFKPIFDNILRHVGLADGPTVCRNLAGLST